MKKQLISFILLTAGFLVGASALSAWAQSSSTWTAPTGAPPACPSGSPGCDAPINVGSSAQSKTGPLGLSALQFNPGGLSTVAPGSVMTATDATGDVAWGALPLMNSQVFNSSGTFTVPAGVSEVKVEVWGGGGGGTTDTSCTIRVGCVVGSSGGGGGGYGEGIYQVTPGGQYVVTVGTGGGGASYSNGNNSGTPGVGGTSSFGSLISATGGAASAGPGGTSNAPININGSSGVSNSASYPSGTATTIPPGTGGSAPDGGGAETVPGGGGSNSDSGASGRVIVWW